MTVRITEVHMVEGNQHEHIGSVKWVNVNPNELPTAGQSTREEMVKFLMDNPGKAIVSDGTNTVQVFVVNATPKYIRTYADGKPTDNLLYLPRF